LSRNWRAVEEYPENRPEIVKLLTI